ncbi:tetratricopeptide repeat protein [Streptomyces sp. NPDC050535]|uniref:P-loop NTPase n=1 Tax=Streptomyces sp. NPDC050535 TaxID=3365626 RepID=UPI0037A9D03E
MELRRAVAVLLRDAEGSPRGNGTGYLLARRLILTARHVLDGVPESGSFGVQAPGGAFVACSVVWQGGRVGSVEVDAALLLAEEDVGDRVAPVRWGRVVTARHHPCLVAGYPVAGHRADGALDVQQPRGTLSPGTGALSHRYTVELTSAPPSTRAPSPWSGQSGAALFCGGSDWSASLLTGVVVADVTGWQPPRWEALPAYVLLADARFRQVVTEHTGRTPALEPVDIQDLVAPRTPWQVRSPATLLDHRAEAVRFHGREELLRAFQDDWCQDGGVRLAVFTGPGGAGKSRFARELSHRLADQHGWVCGWLDEKDPRQGYEVLAEVDRPMLIVVDYAERRLTQLERIASVLDRRPDESPPVRVLLTARSLGEATAGWWDQLRARTRETRALTYDAIHHELEPLTRLAERPARYRDALGDLARQLAQALPRALRELDIDWPGQLALVPDRDLSDPAYGSGLTLHMTALTDLLATHPATRPSEPGLAVEEQLLLHERAYWEDTAVLRPALAATGPVAHAHATAVAVLTAGAPDIMGPAILKTSPGFHDAGQALLAEGAGWLHTLYPAPGGACWGALQPDRLGEYHLGERTLRAPGLLAGTLPSLAYSEESVRALITVSRAGAHPHHDAAVARALDEALRRSPGGVGQSMLSAATLTESPGPLVGALERLTEADTTDPLELLALLESLGAGSSTVLASWGLRTASRLARILHEAGAAWNQLASALLLEGGWLLATGTVEAGLNPIVSAQELYRQHTEALSARVGLASALAMRGQALYLLGRFEESLKACDEARVACAGLPGTDGRDDLRLASSVMNLAGMTLYELGEYEKALKALESAVDTRTALEREDDDNSQINLAMVRGNLAIVQARLGREREALATTELTATVHQRLGEKYPDATGPTTARGLASHANRLRNLGRDAESLEVSRAVLQKFEALAQELPAAYLPDLAATLNNYGSSLVDNGDAVEAGKALERSTGIRRELYAADPDRYGAALASSLNNLTYCLIDLEQPARALATARENLALHTRLAKRKPAAYQAKLAAAYTTLANALTECGELRAALRASRRTIALYRKLARSRPDAHLVDLAQAWNNRAHILSIMDRRVATYGARRMLHACRRLLATRDPERHLATLADDLRETARACAQYGWPGSALAARDEAVAVRRSLVDLSATEQSILELAREVEAQAIVLAELGRFGEAKEALQETLGLVEELALMGPQTYREHVATSRYNLSGLLVATGEPAEARALARSAAEVFRQLNTEQPGKYREHLDDCAERLEIIDSPESPAHGFAAALPQQRRSGLLRRLGRRRHSAS